MAAGAHDKERGGSRGQHAPDRLMSRLTTWAGLKNTSLARCRMDALPSVRTAKPSGTGLHLQRRRGGGGREQAAQEQAAARAAGGWRRRRRLLRQCRPRPWRPACTAIFGCLVLPMGAAAPPTHLLPAASVMVGSGGLAATVRHRCHDSSTRRLASARMVAWGPRAAGGGATWGRFGAAGCCAVLGRCTEGGCNRRPCDGNVGGRAPRWAAAPAARRLGMRRAAFQALPVQHC